MFLFFNLSGLAQKKELRKIEKLVLESFFEEANDALENSKSLILSSDDKPNKPALPEIPPIIAAVSS